MNRRRFGRTGMEISELSLGGGIVGGILIQAPEEVRLETLQRVVRAGGNWIDTAAMYGQGESERALGRLLPHVTPRPHLSTKVNLDPRGGDLAGQVRRSLEASLERLQTDRVDLFQLHNRIGAASDGRTLAVRDILRPGGIADTFDRLREEGFFRFHGITALGETPAILEVLNSGRFDTAQVYYNMLDPTAAMPVPAAWGGQDFTGVLAACRARDVGVMAIRVLAAGVLAGDERHGREVIITSDADLAREEARARRIFARLGERFGTRAQTAIRYALANPALATLVVGFAELDQLGEALAAFEAGPLPEGALAEIAACYEEGV